MSKRQAQSGGGSMSSSARQNEYFVPRDGIDREVITADICRYLGNDALVRPGIYTDKHNRRDVQGYFITAYRNLTTAMIDDLKNDSARWDQERRKHQSGAVRYQDSMIHQAGFNSSSSGYGAGGSSRNDYNSAPKYPGNDHPGYSGSTGGQQVQYSAQGGYQTQPAGYGSSQYPAGSVQYSPQTTDPRYAATTGPSISSYQQAPAVAAGTPWNAGADYRNAQPPPPPPSDYMDTQMRDAPMPAQARSGAYPPTSSQQTYGFQQTGSTPGYPSGGPGQSQAYPQPVDPYYGRASPAGNPGYSPGPPGPYDKVPTSRSSGTPSAQAQVSSSSTSSRREKGHRDDYRDDRSDKRHHRDHYGRR